MVSAISENCSTQHGCLRSSAGKRSAAVHRPFRCPFRYFFNHLCQLVFGSLAIATIGCSQQTPPPNVWVDSETWHANAVEIPKNVIVLAEKDGEFAAFKFTEFEPDRASGVKWIHRDNKFEPQDGERFEVYENYRRVPATEEYVGLQDVPAVERSFVHIVHDMGSELHIDFDTFRLEWSQTSWVYLGEDVRVRLTNKSDLEDVNLSAAGI